MSDQPTRASIFAHTPDPNDEWEDVSDDDPGEVAGPTEGFLMDVETQPPTLA